jgi:hypothetical protein
MIKNASKAGLDFIIFTDHNSIGLKDDKRDLNYNGLQVIAGTEITPECKFIRFEDKELSEDKSNGHLLVFDLDELPDDDLIKRGICQDMIDFVIGKNLLCFVAHPDHKGTKTFGVPSYRCKNFGVTGYIGFSLWDLQTDFQNRAKNITTGLLAFLFPSLALKGPEPETIRRWDTLTKKRSYSIIGELDQHAYKYKFYGLTLTIFKSSFAFKTIRTHVVLKQAVNINEDFKKEVLDALRCGHSYVSFDYFKDATGFMFEAECGSEKYIMGDTITKGGNSVEFSVETPYEADIRIIKDGELFLEQKGDSLTFRVKEKGVYRVEAFHKTLFKLRPWIYSNTIRVV